MKTVISAVLGVLICFAAYGQDDRQTVVLTLDDCITTALENNIQIKRAKNNELIAKSNNLQSLMQFLPTINADGNYDISNGNIFDQNTGEVVNTTTERSRPNLNANLVLFQGLSNYNTRRQREQEFLSAERNTAGAELTTEANILAAYLDVIVSEENIKVQRERVDLLAAQLDREVKRESVGVGNLESVYNFRSQLAAERLNLANLENTFQQNKLRLLQAMQLDPTAANYVVEPYEITEADLLQAPDEFGSVLDQSLNNNPTLQASEASMNAARYQFRAARGLRLPTVAVFGSIGSSFSSNGAFNPATDAFEQDATFLEQMDFNQFEFVQATISIPLFTGFRNYNRIQVAKLSMANAELDNQQAEITATNTVQTVYLDLVAAQNTYQSASENLVALQQSFDFMEKRFQTGNTDFYTYLESLNNKNRAEVQLANAKYSIVLRRRILDLYRGTN